ncbi:MAG: tripartite tricarboxylate transporter substrate binding protein [Alphaproteobacteria bacterium]
MKTLKTLGRTGLLGLGAGLLLGLGTAAVSHDAAAAWEPKKPVTFVIMAGKGGGADRMSRLMQSIIEKHKFSSKPFVPINKPGGAGAESVRYLKDHKGDDHVIMITLNSFYTTPLRNPGLGVDITTYTPIARMAEDTFLLWVHKDSGIKTVAEFVKAAKAKGSKWIMAGTGKGQEDQLLTSFLNSGYGLNMKYVPYKGGGRVAKELAGKNADSTVNNPSEQLGFWQAGKTVPLAAFTPTRLEVFKDVPTFRELGKNWVYFMQRSVVGAPGMSKEAETFYRGVFAQVYATDEWQGYMKKKSLLGGFLTGEALMKYWKRERAIHKKILKDIGEIK